MNSQDFLIKALQHRRKRINDSNNNNSNNNIQSKHNVNQNQLFGSIGEFFIQLAASNSNKKNHLIKQKEVEIDELMRQLRIAKGLLRHMRSPVVTRK